MKTGRHSANGLIFLNMETGKHTEKNSTRWYKNGQLHREDGPAVEWVDGSKEWFIDGKHHRENGPAIEWDDGKREWYLNGVRHRENGPAVEYPAVSYTHLTLPTSDLV